MKDEFDDLFGEYEKEFKDGEKQAGSEKGGNDGEEQKGNKQAKEDEFGDLSELSKMMGVKPKNAAIISGLDKISLCSMCTLCEIPADCFDGNHGSFAMLDVKDRDPEEDARILTQTFRGLEAVLIVNRDQNLSAKVYKEGKEQEKIAPPLILFEFPTLKNYLVGISNLSELKGEGASLNSLSLTKEEALTLLKQIF
ncbi:MAG: hypothetical protein J6S25_01145 [Aeriscardovia sp.]|nr:hypothetical protein [Aeriscardovia sp.]